MLPNMSDVLAEFEISVYRDIYERQTINYVETLTKTAHDLIRAVVQPASQERLQAIQVDSSLRYIQVHSVTELLIGQYIVFGGINYKIVQVGSYQLYGFSDVVAEEVKGQIT